MVDAANGGCGSREQTLLEAAKAFAADVGLRDWSGPAAVKLRAAIAREEAKQAAVGSTAPHVGIVRDPVTGWTFDTMRQQFDAARTTVRVLAAELVAARQQIAGTKGFEA